MSEIRAIIVDDEVHARKKVRALLDAHADVVVVGECENGADAVDAIRAGGVDLVFLDVQMPGMSGLDVVRAVGVAAMPMVVFATAYDRFAVDAFEAHAVDYLLKPIDPDRMARAVEYARERMSSRAAEDASRRLERLLEQIDGKREYARRFAIKSGGAIHVLDVDDVDWIEADGNYVTFHASGKTYLYRETLSNLEKKLDPRRFARIHRSRIVAVDRVERLEPDRHGDFTVVMRDGTRLTLTRTYRANLLDQFDGEG